MNDIVEFMHRVADEANPPTVYNRANTQDMDLDMLAEEGGSMRFAIDDAALREWYDTPEFPVLFPVLSYLWPMLSEREKLQIMDDAAGGSYDLWAGLDYALYQAAHQGIRVPDSLLDQLEAQPAELFNQISIPKSVAALRAMNRAAT